MSERAGILDGTSSADPKSRTWEVAAAYEDTIREIIDGVKIPQP